MARRKKNTGPVTPGRVKARFVDGPWDGERWVIAPPIPVITVPDLTSRTVKWVYSLEPDSLRRWWVEGEGQLVYQGERL